MGLFTGSPGSSSSTSTSNSQYTPSSATMAGWQDVYGTAQGLANYLINNYPPQASVAQPGDLMSSYWQNAGTNTTAPGMQGFQTGMTDAGQASINQYVDPNQINLNQNYNFTPGALQFNNPFAGGTPNVNAPGGVSGLASSYMVNPMQVSGPTVTAQQVQAPGAINPITGLMQVAGPQLQNYQMGPASNVNAPNLQNFQMQAAGNVAPQAQATTQSWTDPGTAAQYMSPYTQQVVQAQQAYATQAYQQQQEQEKSQAAQAGAFGGSREAVQQSINDQSYQLQLANIQAQGLQNAYTQGLGQFNQQQQLGQQAQQFNIGTGLQASLANQQAQQQANVQNLSAYLQTQGLGAQTGLQAQLANQQAGLTVGGQNLQANLQTQGLGAQLGQQAQLANQQQGLQAALANQQAQEFGAGEQLQASLANQQANLQAAQATAGFGMQGQLANQAAGIQTGLAAQQMGLQGAQFNAQTGLQAQLANQAAQMQAMGMQYQGGLQGALQTQQLGMQGQMTGAQMGLTAATQQEQLRQAQQGMNLQGFGQAANIYNQAGNLGLQGFQSGLAGLSAQQQAALSQQGYLQQRADTDYQNQLMNMMTPIQATSWEAQMLGMQPLPYSTSQQGTSNTTYTMPSSSIFSQVLGAGLGAAGVAGGMGWKPFGNQGGVFRDSGNSGLSLVPKRKARGGAIHADAKADRAQMLAILREKGLTKKARGGLGAYQRRAA